MGSGELKSLTTSPTDGGYGRGQTDGDPVVDGMVDRDGDEEGQG